MSADDVVDPDWCAVPEDGVMSADDVVDKPEASLPGPSDPELATPHPELRSAGGEDEDAEMLEEGFKERRACMECHRPYPPNKLLINSDLAPESADWQGHLPTICYPCFQVSDAFAEWQKTHKKNSELEFKKAIKKMWRGRRTGKAEQRQLARATNYRLVVEKIMGHPENKDGAITKKAAHRMATAALSKYAGAVGQALVAWSTHMQEEMKELHQHYVREKDAEAEDPSYVASVDGKHLSGFYLQFFHSMHTGLHKRFHICREINCLFFTLEIYWIASWTDGQLRCPNCGAQYHAFRTDGTMLPAQHVHVLSFPGDDGKLVECYLLAEWPRSAEEGYFLRSMEIEAGLRANGFDDHDHEMIMRKIEEIAKDSVIPFGWDTFHITDSVRKEIAYWDGLQPRKGWASGLAKLEEKVPHGFPGARLTGYGPLTPILTQNDVAILITLVRLATKAAGLDLLA